LDQTGPYDPTLPLFPQRAVTGRLARRLERLLTEQVRRNLARMDQDRRQCGLTDPEAVATDIPYAGHFLGGCACALAVLARCGQGLEQNLGLGSEQLERRAAAIISAWVPAYFTDARDQVWKRFSAGRFMYLLSISAWLVWRHLAPRVQRLTLELLAGEADRYLPEPAPAQLFDDTQAESNSWTGGGLASISCFLRQHPRQPQWEDKAREYLISAFATQEDVVSEQVVDGRPLRHWLHGPNAFQDHTVENHGIVHPDYMTAVSEGMRCAIAYHMAGLPVPQAASFNSQQVLDRLLQLALPDATLLYVQGTDYTPRRVDSLFQAAGLALLHPEPLRLAYLSRCVDVLETMATCDQLPLSAWPGFEYDLGTTWGLTQNLLLTQLCGDEHQILPDAAVEQALSGIHVSEDGCFAIRRTANAVASLSWHDRAQPRRVMGMTMPLDGDVLCYPMPWSGVGQVREAALRDDDPAGASMDVRARHIHATDDGFGVVLELAWCDGKVRQSCAFVALPDGRSVYLEERWAVAPLKLADATCGDLWVYDDLRWPFQRSARQITSPGGPVDMAAASHRGSWLCIDDRLGLVALGAENFSIRSEPGHLCIWRGDGTMYDTLHLAFGPSLARTARQHYQAGERISRFALVTCPWASAASTGALAERLRKDPLGDAGPGTMALSLDPYVVYANFASGEVTWDGLATASSASPGT
jgi:hypothetical protein